MTTLAAAEIEALVTAGHADPTALLGPHPDDSGGLRIIAFLPGAANVTVRPKDGRVEPRAMTRLHEAGLFEARFGQEPAPFPYRLAVTDAGGAVREIDDPYAYPPLLGDLDLHLLAEGSQTSAYNFLGAHVREVRGVRGVEFAVWAPHARWVSVVGDFNDWDGRRQPMRRRGEGGIWELFIPVLAPGARYKFHVRSKFNNYVVDKTDPYAFTTEVRPATAAILVDLGGYQWGDQHWLAERAAKNALVNPMLIYEVHLGSWRRGPGGSLLTYRDLAHQLVDYVKEMGFTHIELLPITEHPTDESWGYLTTGYFTPTSRFGSPHDFMYFVDYCHQHGIGVFLDWVPSHFAKEGHGLGFFDGTHLYEHADPRQGESEWGSYVFNFGQGEVLTFLLSSARFWLDRYHVDGFRVDAVASMLYLDFQRPAGRWVANKYGGRENLEAITFLRRFNELIHADFPGAVTMAEESTSWPMITRPTYVGGLGFTMKWNMGWMHDTLEYFKADPIYRRFLHNTMTFSMVYNYSENFLLPLSHDEVVHGKSPLVYKAPGDEWRKFASLRLMLGYMWAHPGKKLLFMGGEFGQTAEWNFDGELQWWLRQHAAHQGISRWVHDLNTLYTSHPELYALDYDPAGFEWIDCSDADQSVLVMLRRATPDPAALGPDTLTTETQRHGDDTETAKSDDPPWSPPPATVPAEVRRSKPDPEGDMDRQRAIDAARPFLIIACNFTPVVRHDYRIGVPLPGIYEELLNSDARGYGGSGVINEGAFVAQPAMLHGRGQAITFTLPPLGVSVFRLAMPSQAPESLLVVTNDPPR